MKVTSGVRHELVGSAPGRAHVSLRAAVPRGSLAAVHIVRQGSATAARVHSRAKGRSLLRTAAGSSASVLLALGASAVLMACASLPAEPWRVEPMFRVENSSADAAAGYLALAHRLEGEGRNTQAVDAFRKAALAAPLNPDVLNTLGLALARHGQFGPAVTALRKAVALAPERAQLLNNLGYALLLDNRSEEARAIFRLTLAVEPTHEMASRNLAHIEQKMSVLAAASRAPEVSAVQPPAVPFAEVMVEAAPLPVKPAPSYMVVAGGAAEKPAALEAQATTNVGVARSTNTTLDGVSVEIVNGNGIEGAAARVRQLLLARGVEVGRLANRRPYDSQNTRVLYRPGMAAAAQEIAQRLPVDAVIGRAPAGSTRADLSVLLGHDIRQSAGCARLNACAASPVRLASAPGPEVANAGANGGNLR